MKKELKDTNKPKAAMSGYFLFTCESGRAAVKKEFPDLKMTEMGKKISEKWNALPAAEKEQFQRRSDQDRERFKTEMAAYKETDAFKDHAEKVKRLKKENPKKYVNKRVRTISKKDESALALKYGKPKKPLTSWIIHMNNSRAAATAAGKKSISDVAAFAKEAWAAMAPADQKKCEDEAAKLKQEYADANAAWEKSDACHKFKDELAQGKEAGAEKLKKKAEKEKAKKARAKEASKKSKDKKSKDKKKKEASKGKGKKKVVAASSSGSSGSSSSSDSSSDSESESESSAPPPKKKSKKRAADSSDDEPKKKKKRAIDSDSD